MGIANHLPGDRNEGAENAQDPREGMSAEVIDLASRTAYPMVTQRKGKSDALGLAAGVAVVALLGAITLWSMDAGRQAQLTTAPVAAGEAQAAPSAPAPAALLPAEPDQQGIIPTPLGDPAPQSVLAAPPQGQLTSNPHATPTVVFDASALPIPTGPATGEPGIASGNSASDFANRIGGVGGGTARAKSMSNPQTTITQGTMIPAILETAIDTDVPGFVRAVVSQDVRSFDGARILIPRSSRLIGQYQSGMQNGQKRAYVIWTRLIRPDGVSVDLASPATDFAGQTGLPGKVSGNFFKRFGSSVLLSVVGGLSAALTGGATAIVLGGSSSAAAAAATQDGQIGPTVRVRQGEPIRVFTARDLDFSQVVTG